MINGVVSGIDVSHYQGLIDWRAVNASGIDFCFIKATEGAAAIDSAFSRNWREAGSAGIIRGAYHFFSPTIPVNLQADLFLKTVRLSGGNLPPVVDLEGADWAKVPKSARVPMVLAWLKRVEIGTGITPLVYLSPDFATTTLENDPALGRYPLWLAQYAAEAHIPKPWTDWTFWQYSVADGVAGIPGKLVDHDQFAGSIEQLKALTIQ